MVNKLIEEYQDVIDNVKIQQEEYIEEGSLISLGISVIGRA